MNRIAAIITLVLIIIGLIWLNVALAYDQSKPDVDPVTDFDSTFTYVRVRTMGTVMGMYYDDGWKTKETVYGMSGSGYVATEGYIFTAAHVIIPETVTVQTHQCGSQKSKPFKILTRTVLIYNYKDTPTVAKVHYIDKKLDIAILKYKPTGILIPGNREMHYAQEILKQNDVVFSFLHKRDKSGKMTHELELVYGKVLSNLPTSAKMGSELAWNSAYDITLLMDIKGGDSGSALFAFDDGVPIFIGILWGGRIDKIITLTYAVTLPGIRQIIMLEVK